MFDIESRFDALPINQVLLGDAIDVLKSLPDNSVDALISDPPGGLNFMSKAFDHDRGGMIPWVNWLSEIMAESLRVMKPGAIGLVWSIPRTCGWTQLALELAGFKIIDSIAIINGQSMPKGADISKHIDKLHNCDREVVGQYVSPDGCKRDPKNRNKRQSFSEFTSDSSFDITAPNHPDAVKWDGWKSAQLKPSHEDWFIVQKPVEGTIARNILKWGVGGVNIEACRIGTSTDMKASDFDDTKRTAPKFSGILNGGKEGQYLIRDGTVPDGRYPANTILVCSPECDRETHARSCPVSILDEQTSEMSAGKASGRSTRGSNKNSLYNPSLDKPEYIGRRIGFGDGGDGKNASRYFKQIPHDPETFDTFHYFTKASQRDRHQGFEGLVKLKSDLSQEEIDFVIAELKSAGINLEQDQAVF